MWPRYSTPSTRAWFSKPFAAYGVSEATRQSSADISPARIGSTSRSSTAPAEDEYERWRTTPLPASPVPRGTGRDRRHWAR
jgi:hypothetical protein